MTDSDEPRSATLIPPQFLWLPDAPLFIDDNQVSRFHDATVRPLYKQGTIKVEEATMVTLQLGAKVGGEGGLSLGPVGTLLTLGLFNPSVKGQAGGEVRRDSSTREGNQIELLPINTPQRELQELALYYWEFVRDRLFLVGDTRQEDWRKPETIARSPRALALIDLPGEAEAEARGLPRAKLIPTAAEFENGKILLLYQNLKKETGEDRPGKRLAVENPPRYPERAKTVEQLRAERAKYWSWFDENFQATQAILTIEEAASENGRIRWIDYRVPLTTEGDTLHLHICPAGKYDTGVFAYNLVKRGFKHGLRLVGTLKSEPDMNVLAIYEK